MTAKHCRIHKATRLRGKHRTCHYCAKEWLARISAEASAQGIVKLSLNGPVQP
jgi:hypothetical protein